MNNKTILLALLFAVSMSATNWDLIPKEIESRDPLKTVFQLASPEGEFEGLDISEKKYIFDVLCAKHPHYYDQFDSYSDKGRTAHLDNFSQAVKQLMAVYPEFEEVVKSDSMAMLYAGERLIIPASEFVHYNIFERNTNNSDFNIFIYNAALDHEMFEELYPEYRKTA